jgi:hypothetical protein
LLASVYVDAPNENPHLTAYLQIVGSFVIASIMIAMLLDHAFDAKGRVTAHEPLKFARERFLDTE